MRKTHYFRLSFEIIKKNPLTLGAKFFSSGVVIFLTGVGCAGPSTPLGAIWTVKPVPTETASTPATDDEPIESEYAALSRSVAANGVSAGQAPQHNPPKTASSSPPLGETSPRIQFYPAHQVLHAASPLKIVIEDFGGDIERHKITIRYNGYDVTQSFLRRAQVSTDRFQRKITIENPRIRLSPSEEHLIEVTYRNSQGIKVSARYGIPSCYAFKPKKVISLGGFTASPVLLRTIESIARKQGINPSFATGLVAQESGFDPHAVSWAKALGLTQVTSIAETEVVNKFSNWPRYPRLNELSVLQVKALILSGKVNSTNEWRLHPEYSVEGGLEYIIYLARRWSSPENLEKIKVLFKDPEAAHTRLILASYQSGYSRVQSALERKGQKWLNDPDLTEAKKYVNRIFSLCDHFAQDSEVDL